MRNIDFKAELREPDLARGILRTLGAMFIVSLEQRDTHFRLPDGRLMRREATDEPTEWIFYHRNDGSRPRLCTFTMLTDEQARTRWGTRGLEPWLTIVKQREMWLTKEAAIALDDVPGLGRFLEITAMVGADVDLLECHRRVHTLRDHLDPALGEPISLSYADLIAADQANGRVDLEAADLDIGIDVDVDVDADAA
jgi:adenylate cyclase class IV